MMAPVNTSLISRGKRLFDQSGNTVTLKSRRRAIVLLAVFASVVFVVRSSFHDPTEITSRVSPGVFGTRTDASFDDTAGEAAIADAVSVSDVSIAENAPVVEGASVKDGDAKAAPVLGYDTEIREAVKENKPAPVDDDVPRGEPGKCLKHVLYDKPVKTGSTAISFAIRKFLDTKGEKDKSCGGTGPLNCVERAKSICNGTVEEKNYFSILGHLRFGGRELAECLQPKFYVVTSVREPYQRRKSAYLWNRTLNGTHFNIPYTASFQEFMNRMPRCQLYHYYDGRGWDCDIGMSLEDRIQDIVDRVDEVIDIYDEPFGPLHKLIAKYIRRENESIKIDEKDYLEDFDKDTLKEEKLLYDRLRAKRLQPPNKDRVLC